MKMEQHSSYLFRRVSGTASDTVLKRQPEKDNDLALYSPMMVMIVMVMIGMVMVMTGMVMVMTGMLMIVMVNYGNDGNCVYLTSLSKWTILRAYQSIGLCL